MVVPLLVSFYYHDQSHDNFIRSMGVTMLVGLILIVISRTQRGDDYINQKEGMTAVALTWIRVSKILRHRHFHVPEGGAARTRVGHVDDGREDRTPVPVDVLDSHVEAVWSHAGGHDR